MSNELSRKLTEQSLINETQKIVKNYMKIYDEYYSTQSRDSAFLKDLVYVEYKEIHPDYAIEKLEFSKVI